MYSYLSKGRMDEEMLRNLLACHPLDPDPAQDGPTVYAVHEGVDRVVADVHHTGRTSGLGSRSGRLSLTRQDGHFFWGQRFQFGCS